MLERRKSILVVVVTLVLTLPALAQFSRDFEDRSRYSESEPVLIESTAYGSYDWIIDESDVFGVQVDNVLIVDAHKSADGFVGGRLFYRQQFLDNDFQILIRLTCFEIYDGNRAKIGGVVEWANDEIFDGLYGWFQALDNGNLIPTESTIVGFGDEIENEEFCASPDTPNFGPWEVNGRLHVSEEEVDDEGDDEDED